MNCCKKENKNSKGFLSGIFYSLTAHSFCILFIIFTVLGATTFTALLRPFLMSRYFFHILILIVVVFATVSAIFYLRKNNKLSLSGVKERKNYLFILYGTTFAINLLLFIVIFPIAVNVGGGASLIDAVSISFSENSDVLLEEDEEILTVEVDIPCSGHAYLVFSDLDNFSGVKDINFRFPNIFDIKYDPLSITPEEILSVDVFESYKTIIK